jgi:hypothetical protein
MIVISELALKGEGREIRIAERCSGAEQLVRKVEQVGFEQLSSLFIAAAPLDS